jgi:inner membrane protein
MMFRTHLAFGFLSALATVKFVSPQSPVIFAGIIIFSSLFPDLDHKDSFLGSRVPFSFVIRAFFGHRGFMHSVFPPLILFIFFNNIYILAIAIGYLSHVIIDALTARGINPFYPLYNIKLSGFIVTGSIFESAIFIMLILTNFIMLGWYI